MTIMVMDSQHHDLVVNLVEELDLHFPILLDPGRELFGRWNSDLITPSATYIDRGSVIQEIDAEFDENLILELLSGD